MAALSICKARARVHEDLFLDLRWEILRHDGDGLLEELRVEGESVSRRTSGTRWQSWRRAWGSWCQPGRTPQFKTRLGIGSRPHNSDFAVEPPHSSTGERTTATKSFQRSLRFTKSEWDNVVQAAEKAGAFVRKAAVHVAAAFFYLYGRGLTPELAELIKRTSAASICSRI